MRNTKFHQKKTCRRATFEKFHEIFLIRERTKNIFSYLDGDLLIGSGFGLRTIIFGLPLRYDLGWAYNRDGFSNQPIHYFSIGIDF